MIEKDKAIPLIIWQKFEDPFCENIEDMEFPGFLEEITNKQDDQSISEPEYNQLDQNESFGVPKKGINQILTSGFLIKRPIKVLISNHGILPLAEESMPSKFFNMWWIHTRFKLTFTMKKFLDNLDGVEALDVYTQYRARIAIGKCFTKEEVHKSILKEISSGNTL